MTRPVLYALLRVARSAACTVLSLIGIVCGIVALVVTGDRHAVTFGVAAVGALVLAEALDRSKEDEV